MAIFEWRKFNFFDLRKGVDKDRLAETLQGARITATATGNNLIVICDSEGMIHTFSRSWEPISFKGHEGSILLADISKQNNLLVTVGEDINGPSFKVWNLAKVSAIAGAQCLRTVRTMVSVPSALAVSEGGQFMAIGFAQGNISLYRGDISRDRSKTLKQLTAGSTSISGIAFKHSHKVTQMFVCSDSGVYLYNLQSRDKEIRINLDTVRSPVGCCALQTGHNEGHFMVGRDDAVYCYTSDGRGPCYALEGKKTLLQWFRSHLLIVSKNTRAGAGNGFVLTVIDIQNKFIVFTCPIEEVVAILTEFGSCYILTESKQIFHLDEKDLQSKLNLLFKKNLYDIAVRIAKSNQYDADGLAGIFKQYGDHLYSKGDFSGSVDQYIKTIGFLEPSYVIRRFLDARHIHYLTDYLQAIHKSGRASADHTTLLLNCFTRLDRTEQLKQFLENENKLNLFDVDVAIKVCRNASVEQALALAKVHRKHDLCLSILTEDLSRYDEALVYIQQLPFTEAERNVKKYGHLLMEHCPNQTIVLLKKLCTEYIRTDLGTSAVNDHFGDDVPTLFENEINAERGNPEDFIHLFKDDELLIDFLEHLICYLPSCSQFVYNSLVEHYLYRWHSSGFEQKLLDLLKSSPDRYDKNHVLIQCRLYQFWPGVMYLYEEDKLYHLIVRHYLRNRDYENLLACCRKLGQTDASLWLLALNGLKNDEGAPPKLLSQVLQVIAQEKLQAPLQILNCLAVNSGPTLLPVRDYFMQVFHKEQESTRHDEELTRKYSEETVSIKRHIKQLQEGNVEFRNTVCDTCKQPLSWPALFFLCKHSYHQDCIRGYSETERDCPVCAKKNIQWMDALRAQSESRGQHEAFHNLLDRSPEPFSVVAEYFGRGLFNKLVIVEEDTNHLETSTVQPDSAMHQLSKQTENMRITKPIPTASNNSSNAFGPGAEARIRQEESRHLQVRLEAQESEMRLRLLEQERIRQRQQATLLAQQQFRPRGEDRSSKLSPYGSPKPPSTLSNYSAMPKQPSPIPSKNPPAATRNPFDEDEGNDYDNSKDPFADDATPKKTAPDAGNPFGEDYDSALDPFAE
ncbi:vacuolar protein sorting-associated protein 11 homolog [Uranotaenia lowii]|uniref:vacuolar protein sorting-associated protein 11 homolog n=1 Tax=Uranotaenia lowii TaxID=190385 RepID=UPI00247B0EA5|nr:vacuolar protein sorting-associated protein 11 homolog [Uranotaenia lowii]